MGIHDGESGRIRDDRVFLTELLLKRHPFGFVRFGDGNFEAMTGLPGAEKDGQEYNSPMCKELIWAWNTLSARENCHLTAWCPDPLRPMLDPYLRWVKSYYFDHGVLLLHEITPEIESFYRALVRDPRKKILVGPAILKKGADLLGCSALVEVPKPNAYSKRDQIVERAFAEYIDDAVYLFCASSMGKILACLLFEAHEQVTCIDLGSALDPICIGNTRNGQADYVTAWRFFKSVRDAGERGAA